MVNDPEDVLVQVDAFTICGTDLHILRGDVPEVEPGRVLGHEAVGTVTSAGAGVRSMQPAGLVDTHSTPRLLAMLQAGRIDIGRMVTHRFGFDEVRQAYDLFDDPVASGALKVAVLRG